MSFEIRPENKQIQVGKFYFSLAGPAFNFGGELEFSADMGKGVAYYKDGRYVGYHILPDKLAGLPIEDVVKTDQFQDIYKEIVAKHSGAN
jgi:hypothetical protein